MKMNKEQILQIMPGTGKIWMVGSHGKAIGAPSNIVGYALVQTASEETTTNLVMPLVAIDGKIVPVDTSNGGYAINPTLAHAPNSGHA